MSGLWRECVFFSSSSSSSHSLLFFFLLIPPFLSGTPPRSKSRSSWRCGLPRSCWRSSGHRRPRATSSCASWNTTASWPPSRLPTWSGPWVCSRRSQIMRWAGNTRQVAGRRHTRTPSANGTCPRATLLSQALGWLWLHSVFTYGFGAQTARHLKWKKSLATYCDYVCV